MRSFKLIPILALIFLSFFLIRGFVYSTNDTNDTSITDSSTIPLESNPRCIAINPFTNQAVVTSVKPNLVFVIDLSTQEVLSSIHIGKKCGGVAIDPELNLALVNSSHDDTLSIIDLGTYRIIRKIKVGESPQGIAVNEKTHIALVANKEDNSVSVIDLNDLNTFRVLRRIRVGKEPRDVAIDPGLNLALVANEESDNVSVIDLNTYEVKERIRVGKEPRAISINPETHLAVVANEESNSVTLINLQSGEIKRIRVEKHPIDVAANPLNNRAVVLCDKDRSLLLIDLNTHTITHSYDINKLSRGVAVDPFTNIAAVVDDKTDSVTLIQLPNPVPEVDSLFPITILRGSGTTRVIVEGSGFIRTSTVSGFHSDFIDNHHLEVSIPGSLINKTGTYHLVVINPPPEGGPSNPVGLNIANPKPALSELKPSEAVAGSQAPTLSVYGTGFFEDTLLSINGTTRGFTLIDQTKLEIPLTDKDLEAGGYLQVTAFNPPPEGGTSNSLVFTVRNPVPSLSSLVPSSVIAGSSDFNLTLTGDNFVKISAVSFNNQQVSSSYVSKNQLQATISSDAIETPGNYPVKVINPAPGGGETQQLTFTVNQLLPPVEPQPEGSFGEKYQDLIPYDSTVKSYDAKRFSLITGLVRNVAGSPIPGVSITILTQPGYGTAGTDTQGRFSIPVEGGGTLTVVYQKEGLLTAHRKVYVPWNDIAIAETIVMIPQDSASTTLAFDGNPNTVITHQSTGVTDDRGSRSSTVVFTGDNRAYSVDASGNVIQELTTITTRATEFVTEQSMPAKLPPNSAYTYCVEPSVEGAQRVRFNKPVIMWVDNFLGFNVGEKVPVGYYDREKGIWVPSDNGLVVRLLDTHDGIVDALDANGDGLPDDLNGNGSFNDEVAGLSDSQKYPPGSTFWRIQVTHFTPWDCNWPYGPPADATAPNPKGVPVADQQKQEESDCRRYSSSFVEERSRIFHEDIPIPGTEFTLHYTSSRVKGYQYIFTVPASGETLPASLKRIIVQLNIAGRSFEQTLSPLPNQKVEFVWDGLDFLGKTATGPAKAELNVGFVYNAVYYSAGSFAQSFAKTGSQFTNIQARQEVISWRRSDIEILAKTKSAIAEGWTLSNHHYVSPMDSSTLYKGDGTIVTTIKNKAIDTVAGSGTPGSEGDGGPATQAQLTFPNGVATDASGNLYIADSGNDRIRKVDTNGIISTVAGTGASGYSGDGGPATQAKLDYPAAVAVDGLGNLYITDSSNYRIRKVDTSGVITTVAGNGISGYGGDEGLATQAALNFPNGVAVDASGNLYIADTWNHRIRKVDTNGVITTVAGDGTYAYGGDGGPATQAKIASPWSVAVDVSGNLYITDSSNYRIRKVDTSGVITTVAGTGTFGYSGDGGEATEARISYSYGIEVDVSGNIYFSDYVNNRIRKVDTDGIIITVAGKGSYGYSGDGGPPTQAELTYPVGVAVDASGNLIIGDYANHRIRKVTQFSIPSVITTEGEIAFADTNGQGYLLTNAGRHRKTIDLDTGISLYEFGYDQNNSLVSITDRFGNKTVINRDNSAIPTSIISPDGITTTLTIDTNNYLKRITYPDGNFYSFEYTLVGLMSAKIEPKGNRFEHIFDSIGRLTEVTDQEGGYWQFSRQVDVKGDVLTQMLTGEGNLTSYLHHTDSTGAYTSHITDPSGAETLYSSSGDGLTATKSLPCGMALSFKYGVDSQYRFNFVKEMKETTQSNLERIILREKTYQDTNSEKTPDLITEKVTLNGKLTTLLTDTIQSKKTMTSPLGRKANIFYDPNNLITKKLTIPGLFDTDFGYDTRGRLTSIYTNTRQTAFTYDTQGNLYSITDPENHTTTYVYDAVGRLTRINRPDASSIGLTYDKNGNMTVLTDPSTINHGFGYNQINLNSSYQTPLSGSYSYLYNRDRRLIQIDFPSGKQIKYVYDKDRLIQSQTPEGNIDLTYLCGSKLGSIKKGTEVISYGYDGSLVASETFSGTLNQLLTYSYNSDFNIKSLTYAGNTVNYTYDNDGLLTAAGSFTITRNTGNGLPEAVTRGALNVTRTFNGYGELESQNFVVNGLSLTSWALNRDKTGRIISKTETVEGITSNYIYTYDSAGRLLTVTKGGDLVEEYQYGPNGNRTYEMNVLKGISGRTFAYSDEDHLLTAGDTSYQYDLDGFLTTKTQGTEVTRYSYSSSGELLRVDLPVSTVIEYINDPLGRRIAKKLNGVINEKYLWQGLTRLLAVYDSNDNLVTRFEYAGARMPIGMTKDGITYYMTYDQVGSLRLVTDSAGNVIKKIDYDSFGNIISDTNPTFQIPFGFAGGLHDRDTDLIKFGYRDYDPDVGRWTAKDLIGFAGGDIDLYGYVANNPTNNTDPTGEILPAVIVIPTAVVLIVAVTTGYIVPFFLDVPPLPKGAPPGSLNPGYPGPVSPGPCPINEPPPISGPPPPLPPTLPPRVFIPSR